MHKLVLSMILLSTLFFSTGFTHEIAVKGKPAKIMVEIINQQGKKIGVAQLQQEGDKVKLQLQASSLSPGLHGIHFHETGLCDPPDFKTAGAHFNPTHKKHGFKNPAGYHAGDLPNIEADQAGNVHVTIETKAVTLLPGKPNSLLQPKGTSLIIHAQADDYITDPAGNSGDRVACGVIR